MSTPRKIVFILILLILFSSPLLTGANARAAVGKWEVFELTLTTSNSYSNPYTQVTLTATFTSPSSNTIQMPGFWDGGQTWKVRMAPNEIGTWTYSTASDPIDSGLETSGTFECVASGKKGFIKVNPSDRYKFQYADGTPFFWMGDTCWHLFCDDIVYDTDFKDYIDRRASQHFTNIHAGLYCGDVYENEGGKPFPGAPGDMDNLNPDYFRYVDRKVDYIASKGMVMGLFLTWAQQFIYFSRAQFERYEKYVIARYTAYNVYWVVSGEYDEASTPSEYAYHGNVIDQVDPYDHPISIHTTTTNNEFGNDAWLSYIMQQKFEQDSSIMLNDLLNQLNRPDVVIVNNVSTSIADGNHLYSEIGIDRIFDKPVVNAEFGYEQYDGWTGRTNRTTPDTVRRLAWNLVMAGGFFTYGMEATYKAFDGGGSFSWKLPAQELGGSDYMKLLYEFMTGTRWWEMNPDNSVITSGQAVALVNPGTEYVVYLRSGSSVSVDLSAVSGDLNVLWFDTKDGDRFSQGTVSGGGVRAFTKPAGIDGEGVLHLYDPGVELVVDFGVGGLWDYDGSSWSRLTSSIPQHLAVYGGKLMGDFGSGGLWEFDGTSWTKLTPSDADNSGNCMVAYGASLVVDFGSGGIWEYDGSSTWSRLTGSDPQYVAVYGTKLVGDFGSGGLWEFDGTSWTKLTPSDADNSGNCMVAYGASLVVDFGGGGIWEYDGSGTWSRLTGSDPQYLAVYGTKLVGDFGSGGLWEFDGTSWTKLTPSDADNSGNCMVAYGASLVVDFGSGGIWEYDGSSTWSRLTGSDPQYVAVYGTKLVGDFGSGGLWEFDGTSWSKLTPSDADNNGNCMVAVNFM